MLVKTSIPAGREGGFPSDRSLAVKPSVLFVSDNEQAHTFLRNSSRKSQWSLHAAFSYNGAVERLANLDADVPVVLYDGDLRASDWRAFLDLLQDQGRSVRLIVFSRTPEAALWGEVFNLGAWDLLSYPFDDRELIRAVSAASESWFRERLWNREITAAGFRKPVSTAGGGEPRRTFAHVGGSRR